MDDSGGERPHEDYWHCGYKYRVYERLSAPANPVDRDRTRTGKEWKSGFARPISASLHSALSPVLASLDVFNANYQTRQPVRSDLCLINDSWHDANIHVDLLITREDPERVPEAARLQTPVAKWSYDYDPAAVWVLFNMLTSLSPIKVTGDR